METIAYTTAPDLKEIIWHIDINIWPQYADLAIAVTDTRFNDADQDTLLRHAAEGVYLQTFYTIMAYLRYVAKNFDGRLPFAPDYAFQNLEDAPALVIKKMAGPLTDARPAVISPELAALLYDGAALQVHEPVTVNEPPLVKAKRMIQLAMKDTTQFKAFLKMMRK